jgi:aldose 1-epimerase
MEMKAPRSAPLPENATAVTLKAGSLEATFLPSHGMLGASLRHQGEEILGRVDDLGNAALKGSAAGIPFLHPWANRLAGYRYRAAGKEVTLDPSSPLLHFDENGLPIHGVPWPLLSWEVIEVRQNRLAARLEWSRQELLSVFPFRHRLEMTASLAPNALTFETMLVAGGESAVPVSFGFHPYLRLPGLPRANWRLRAPAMQKLVLDGKRIPAGKEEPFGALDTPLGDLDLDDGFALSGENQTFSIAGAGRLITAEWLEGYRYVQIYAPRDKDYAALEPMTAPANALVSGQGLGLVEPGKTLRAVFRIRLETL